jgi:hypothetical protein
VDLKDTRHQCGKIDKYSRIYAETTNLTIVCQIQHPKVHMGNNASIMKRGGIGCQESQAVMSFLACNKYKYLSVNFLT